jgi:hypothetical protein
MSAIPELADDLDSAPIDDNAPGYLNHAAEYAGRQQPRRRFGGTGASQMDRQGEPLPPVSSRQIFAEEHPDVIAWIDANQSFQFAESLSAALDKYGYLTEGQLAAVLRCIARDADKETQRKASVVNVAGAGFTALVAAFNKAKASGLKHPALTFENVTFKLAGERSKNPGYLYIAAGKHFGSEYYGKVSPGGVFTPAYVCPESIRDEVKRIGADPLGESVAHGRRTGNCCACNRPLTDPESVANGIGPICRERFFGGF